MESQPRFTVQIKKVEKPYKLEKALQQSLKGVVSPKMIRQMKLESISCPVMSKELQFLECLVCSNFLRRVKGEVHCAGAANPTRIS